MPGVPSSAPDGPRAPGDAADQPDRTLLPHRLWTRVLVAGLLTLVVLGILLPLLELAGAPVPPAVSGVRAYVPWVPQDAWSVAADAGWAVVVSLVAAGFLRQGLRRRGTAAPSLPALPDLAVLVLVAYAVACVVWPLAFPDVRRVAPALGAMLLTILLLRAREVWAARDVLGPWGPRRWAVAAVVVLALVAPYAAWHPLRVERIDVTTSGAATLDGGDGASDIGRDGQRTSVHDDAVSVRVGPGRTVSLLVDLLAGSGGVRLLAATPVVPAGDFRLLPPRRGREGSWDDGAPLPRRLAHRSSSDRRFRLRSRARCRGGRQRIDRVRVRYERLGRTVTTELATGAPLTLHCSR